MRPEFLSRIKLTRPKLLRAFSMSFLFCCLMFAGQIGRAQQVELSLADILVALRSKKATLPERNKILSDAVKVRGVTFSLTPQIETELGNTGADEELIGAIRQKSVKIVTVASVKPTPAATPAPVPAATPTPAPTPAPTPDFAFYRKRADENSFKGEYDLAVSDYNEALKLNPKDALAYLNRGRAFSGKSNYDSAITDYSKAIELNPKDAAAYFNRADSYEKKGSTQQAISDYQKTVDLDAANDAAKNNLKRLQAAEQAKIQAAEQAKIQAETKKTEPVAVTTPPKPAVETPQPIVESSNPPHNVELGELNKYAVKMTLPIYPQIAQRLNVQGTVTVQISLDETGKVVSAKATNGNSMLRSAAEDAARMTKFKPAVVGNRAVKSTGFIVYNFVNKQ